MTTTTWQTVATPSRLARARLAYNAAFAFFGTALTVLGIAGVALGFTITALDPAYSLAGMLMTVVGFPMMTTKERS